MLTADGQFVAPAIYQKDNVHRRRLHTAILN